MYRVAIVSVSQKIVFSLNSELVQVDTYPQTPLLYVLRNDFLLNGPKYGCGLGECGACSVLIGGKVARSCITPIVAVIGKEVCTLEGLGTLASPGIVQQAFIDEQAAQCGYCMNGMIMTTTAFLQNCSAKPSTQQIKNALRANLCRCGTHIEIIKAAKKAADVFFIASDVAPEEEV